MANIISGCITTVCAALTAIVFIAIAKAIQDMLKE